MKRLISLVSCLLTAMLPLSVSAQITTNSLKTELGTRLELTLDKHLAGGLHLELEGEARTAGNFTDVGRYNAKLGLSYSLNQNFKFGLGYIMIEKKNSLGEWDMRHRLYADAEGVLYAGDWGFSLRERLQLTHRDVNVIKKQDTPNSLTLKSRLKAAYKGFSQWEPYAYAEFRHVFNDPACSATWNSVSQSFEDYVFLGYSHTYLNRIRGCVGAEWALDSHNSLDFYLLTDYRKEKETDTTDNGTRLKALYWDQILYGAICVGYKFSF